MILPRVAKNDGVINVCFTTIKTSNDTVYKALNGGWRILYSKLGNFVLNRGVTKADISLARSGRGTFQNPFSKSNLVTYLAFPILSIRSSTRGIGKESDFVTLFTLL